MKKIKEAIKKLNQTYNTDYVRFIMFDDESGRFDYEKNGETFEINSFGYEYPLKDLLKDLLN